MGPGRARAFMAAAFLLVFGLGLPWIKIPGLELGGPLSTWIAISSDPQVLAAIYLLEVAIALAAALAGLAFVNALGAPLERWIQVVGIVVFALLVFLIFADFPGLLDNPGAPATVLGTVVAVLTASWREKRPTRSPSPTT